MPECPNAPGETVYLAIHLALIAGPALVSKVAIGTDQVASWTSYPRPGLI